MRDILRMANLPSPESSMNVMRDGHTTGTKIFWSVLPTRKGKPRAARVKARAHCASGAILAGYDRGASRLDENARLYFPFGNGLERSLRYNTELTA